MPLIFPKQSGCQSGYQPVEIAMMSAIVVILLTFGIVTYGNLNENKDATLVQAAQASLQTVVIQGATRQDINPMVLVNDNPGAVVLAVQSMLAEKEQAEATIKSVGAGSFVLDMPAHNRQATFQVDPSGNVRLVTLSGFTAYLVDAQDGTIQKP